MNFDEVNASEVNYADASSVSLQADIVFDGYSLQNLNFITSKIDYDDIGKVELNSFNYPRTDGGGVLSKYYRWRSIKLNGFIKKDTVTEFNDFIDEIKKNLRKTEGLLEVVVNGEIRRIKATVTDLSYNREHYNITFSPISITFTAVEPFFYASVLQSASFLGKTATYTEEMENEGGADSSPTIYFVFWTWTTATALQFTDPSDRDLNITTAITNGDIIIINSVDKVVTKNGTEIDYTGAFPIFAPGSNNFTVTMTGTVLVDTTLTLPKNYL